MKIKIIILIFLLMFLPAADASILDSIIGRLKPQAQQYHVTAATPNIFKDYYYREIDPMNTPENIALISQEMKVQGIGILRVYVSDYNQNFYVVKDLGAMYNTDLGKVSDHYVVLTVNDIQKVKNIISDNKLTFFEKIEIWSMIKNKKLIKKY